MGRFFSLLFLIDLALVVVALIDCLSTERDEVRALPRFAWVILIVLFSPVGPIVWFYSGRPQRDRVPTEARIGYVNRGRPRRPVAPDDDPEFLENLTSTADDRRRDEELLRRWEEDLRRGDDDDPRKDDV
jgi:hypothetical protein